MWASKDNNRILIFLITVILLIIPPLWEVRTGVSAVLGQRHQDQTWSLSLCLAMSETSKSNSPAHFRSGWSSRKWLALGALLIFEVCFKTLASWDSAVQIIRVQTVPSQTVPILQVPSSCHPIQTCLFLLKYQERPGWSPSDFCRTMSWLCSIDSLFGAIWGADREQKWVWAREFTLVFEERVTLCHS